MALRKNAFDKREIIKKQP